MIFSKPKLSSILSIMVFSLLLLAVAIYGFYVWKNSNTSWYHYVYMIGFGPIALGLILRQIFQYKTIYIGKNKLMVSYLFQCKNTIHSLSQLEQWHENSIKTPSGEYKQLELVFNTKHKVRMSIQEYTEYPHVVKYLKKKQSHKMIA